MSKDKIELGDLAKDTITGYVGVVVSFTKHITGCDRFTLQAQLTEKEASKLPDAYNFDVTTIELVKKSVVKVNLKPLPEPEIKHGGPHTKVVRS